MRTPMVCVHRKPEKPEICRQPEVVGSARLAGQQDHLQPVRDIRFTGTYCLLDARLTFQLDPGPMSPVSCHKRDCCPVLDVFWYRLCLQVLNVRDRR